MSALNDPLFTKTFIGAETFEIKKEDGISKYSIKAKTNNCTILGTKVIRGIISDPIELEEGQVFNGSSQNQACCFTVIIPVGSVVEIAASNE